MLKNNINFYKLQFLQPRFLNKFMFSSLAPSISIVKFEPWTSIS